MRIRWLLVLLAVVFCISLFSCYSSSPLLAAQNNVDPKIAVDGKSLDMGDQLPFIYNNRVMVPIRVVSEYLGGKVSWLGLHNVVLIELNGREIELVVNSKQVTVDGVVKTIDVAPMKTTSNRIVVPLRFISEVLGFEVEWDSINHVAYVFSSGYSLQEKAAAMTKFARYLKGYQTSFPVFIGETKQDVLSVLGQPIRKELGYQAMEVWTYHNRYKDYYQVGFKGEQVALVYTNKPGEDVFGVAVGDSRSQVQNKVQTSKFSPLIYDDGYIKVYFQDNDLDDSRIYTLNGDLVFIFYIDRFEGDKVWGIKALHKDIFAEDHKLINYRMTYIRDINNFGKIEPGNKAKAEIAKSYERQIFDLTNVIRVQKGLKPLLWHDGAAKVAYAHSKDMNDRDYFNHICPSNKGPGDRAKAAGVYYIALYENIAKNYANSIEVIHGWMDSDGHRSAILARDNTHLGVGVFYSKDIYYTQLFLQTSR